MQAVEETLLEIVRHGPVVGQLWIAHVLLKQVLAKTDDVGNEVAETVVTSAAFGNEIAGVVVLTNVKSPVAVVVPTSTLPEVSISIRVAPAVPS